MGVAFHIWLVSLDLIHSYVEHNPDTNHQEPLKNDTFRISEAHDVWRMEVGDEGGPKHLRLTQKNTWELKIPGLRNGT